MKTKVLKAIAKIHKFHLRLEGEKIDQGNN